MARVARYLDDDGLLRYFPNRSQGSDTLTAYVLSVADEAGYEIAPEVREKMEAGLLAFVEGRVLRYSDLATADLAVRKVAALEALSRQPFDVLLLDADNATVFHGNPSLRKRARDAAHATVRVRWNDGRATLLRNELRRPRVSRSTRRHRAG